MQKEMQVWQIPGEGDDDKQQKCVGNSGPCICFTFSTTNLQFTSTEQSSTTIVFNTTVEPPNRGHFGTTAFVLSSEVVLFSEVA